ncbi:MAG: alpha/beta hydrolase [Dehalococcoidia bacterium]
MIALLRRSRAETAPFLGPDGGVLDGSIAEAGYVTLGGVRQWVMVRGANVANPVLIFLHGGPGFSETRLFRHFNSALEEAFTVVYWDQRGTAKSFNSAIPRASMTVEQFLLDLDALVEDVRARLRTERVTLFGHSWGSALGVLYAHRFPGKVAAYVGSGQVGDWPAAETASYAYALGEAGRQRNREALKTLRAIGPPPHTAQDLWVQRTTLQRLDGQLSAGAMWRLGRIFLGGGEYSVLDLAKLLRGFKFSLDAMWSEVSRIDLNELAPRLEMPVFFFLGRQDHWVPGEISAAYLDALDAPSKELVWFEQSGHEPFADEPEKFNASMLELVWPVARAAGRGASLPRE